MTEEGQQRRWMCCWAPKPPTPPAKLGGLASSSEMFLPEFKTTLSMSDFEVLDFIAQGAFGKVSKVRKKDTGKIYAMKVVEKENIMKSGLVAQSKAEEILQLQASKHSLIVNLRYAFQTADQLCFVLDYVGAGDLYTHVKKAHHLPEELARFYAAEVLVALEFLHSIHIVYRDLKMENVLVDEQGHIRLTDFGLAKRLGGVGNGKEVTDTVCGTPEYMAPDFYEKTDYGVNVDWWAYGVLLYVMMVGHFPWSSQDRSMLNHQITHDPPTFPSYLSEDAKDIILKFFAADSSMRYTGDEAKKHPFFVGVDWDRVSAKAYDPHRLSDMSPPQPVTTQGDDAVTSPSMSTVRRDSATTRQYSSVRVDSSVRLGSVVMESPRATRVRRGRNGKGRAPAQPASPTTTTPVDLISASNDESEYYSYSSCSGSSIPPPRATPNKPALPPLVPAHPQHSRERDGETGDADLSRKVFDASRVTNATTVTLSPTATAAPSPNGGGSTMSGFDDAEPVPPDRPSSIAVQGNNARNSMEVSAGKIINVSSPAVLVGGARNATKGSKAKGAKRPVSSGAGMRKAVAEKKGGRVAVRVGVRQKVTRQASGSSSGSSYTSSYTGGSQ